MVSNWTLAWSKLEFCCLGLFFGVLLTIEKFFLGKLLEKLPSIMQNIYVLFLIMISFIIFNATDMGQAVYNILGLFGANGEGFINKETIYYLKSYLVLFNYFCNRSNTFTKNSCRKTKIKHKR